MGTQEVVLRPGDSISLRIELPGRHLRLDVSLSEAGANLTARDGPPVGAPTMYGGVAPREEEAPIDLTAELEAARQPESVDALEPVADAGTANPKKKFEPGDDDTLPVWTDKARGYREPGEDASPTGGFAVFLSPPGNEDKRRTAAEIISDIQGVDLNTAMARTGKMIVPVVKDVDEDIASRVRERFKQAGLSCRITQKR